VPGGTEEIEIIGTQVIPEFGILAALVLAAAVGAIVVLSRRTQMLKLLPSH
jgi:predicted secreted protein with PEFG-CTERM motif